MWRVGGRGRTNGRIEQPARDAEEDPRGDDEREAETEADEDELVEAGRRFGRQRVGDLCAGEGEEEEQRRPHELARHGHEVRPHVPVQEAFAFLRISSVLVLLHLLAPGLAGLLPRRSAVSGAT